MKIDAIEITPAAELVQEALVKEEPVVVPTETLLAELTKRVDDLTDKVNELILGHNDTQTRIEPQRNIVEQFGNVKQVTVYGKV